MSVSVDPFDVLNDLPPSEVLKLVETRPGRDLFRELALGVQEVLRLHCEAWLSDFGTEYRCAECRYAWTDSCHPRHSPQCPVGRVEGSLSEIARQALQCDAEAAEGVAR